MQLVLDEIPVITHVWPAVKYHVLNVQYARYDVAFRPLRSHFSVSAILVVAHSKLMNLATHILINPTNVRTVLRPIAFDKSGTAASKGVKQFFKSGLGDITLTKLMRTQKWKL